MDETHIDPSTFRKMGKKQKLIRRYPGALLLIIALSGLGYGAQPGPDIAPRRGSVSDLPSDLEGNWFINWKGEGRAWAVLNRQWELKRIEARGGGHGYFNRVHETDKRWSLTYTSDLENWGGTSPSVDEKTGRMEIKWGYGTLGGWGGRSELRGTPPNKISGAWKYETGSPEHNKGGGEVWERAVPVINHVVFQVASWSWGTHEPSPKWEWTPGGPPVRIEMPYSGPQEDMRANRPQFKVMIYGDNLWGHHLIDVNGALDLEPLHEWRNYLLLGGGKTSAYSAPPHVQGIEQFVVIWPKAQSGKYALRIDGISIPFELVIKGAPAQTVNPAATTAGSTAESASFIDKILPFLLIGLLLGAAAALGPVGWVIGAGLSVYGFWQSYHEGGWQKVWDDFTPHEFMELIVDFEKLSGLQRLEKFFMGGMKVVGLVGGFVGGRRLAATALQRGKRAIQQGRGALDALRRRVPVSAARPQMRPVTQKLDAVPGVRKGVDKMSRPAPPSQPKRFVEAVRDNLKGEKPISWSTIDPKKRYGQLHDVVKKKLYDPLHSKLSGSRKADPMGDKARRDTLLKIEGGRDQGGGAWVNWSGEAQRRGEDIAKRIHVNAHADHAAELMQRIEKDIIKNESGLHQAKTAVKNPDRVDNTVLYLTDEESMQRALKQLEKIQAENPHWFRADTPPMTAKHAPGISTCDHPPKVMMENAQKIIAERLSVPLSDVPGNFSTGNLRNTAGYFGWEDLEALKAKAGVPKLSPEAEAGYLDKFMKDHLRNFGFDANDPSKLEPRRMAQMRNAA